MYTHYREYDPNRPLIEIKNVSKRFVLNKEQHSLQERLIQLLQGKERESADYFWPIRNLSLTLHPGDCVGLIGPNGTGKSTLLKLVTGIIEPNEGEVMVNGPFSSLLELGAGFHPDLTGRENIFLNGSIYGLNSKELEERQESIIEFAELEKFIDVPVKHYSSGMYVRLGFSIAIHTDPKLLLIDEVLAVGDAHFQAKCINAIHQFRKAGGTLMLVSHDLTSVQSLCNRAIWIEDGELQADGAPTDTIMAYIQRVAQREGPQHDLPVVDGETPKRWGTGEVKVNRIEFCNAQGNSQMAFFTGEPMEIRLTYSAENRLPDVVFGLGVYHQGGAHICGPNTKLGGLTIPSVDRGGQIVYRIPHLPLLEGVYEVSIAVINNTDTIMYDYHDRLYQFRVFPGKTLEKYGLVTLNGAWSVEGDQATPVDQPTGNTSVHINGSAEQAETLAPTEVSSHEP